MRFNEFREAHRMPREECMIQNDECRGTLWSRNQREKFEGSLNYLFRVVASGVEIAGMTVNFPTRWHMKQETDSDDEKMS